MGIDMDLGQLWDAIGPIVIGVIAAIVVAIILLIVRSIIPDGPLLRLYNSLAAIVIIVVFAGAIYIASGIWGKV